MRLFVQLLLLISEVIFYIAAGVAALLVLRVFVAWVSKNPFAWLPYNLRRVTEPLVQPLRSPLGNQRMRFDLIPLVAAILVFGFGSVVAYLISRFAGLLGSISQAIEFGLLTPKYMAWWSIGMLGLLFEAAIFMRFVLPWLGVGYSNSFMRFIHQDHGARFSRPIRRKMLGQFLMMSSFDFTPILALFLVQIVTRLLASFFRMTLDVRPKKMDSIQIKIRVLRLALPGLRWQGNRRVRSAFD